MVSKRRCHTVPVTLEFTYKSYVKAYGFTDEPALIETLEDDIEAFIREISPEMLKRVCQNRTKRMGHIGSSRCQHYILQKLNYMDRIIYRFHVFF